MDPVTSEVTLAHSSVKAFLTSKWRHSSTTAWSNFEAVDANRQIARSCLAFLLLQRFSSGYCPTYEEFQSQIADQPLKYYAARQVAETRFGWEANTNGHGSMSCWEQQHYRGQVITVLGFRRYNGIRTLSSRLVLLRQSQGQSHHITPPHMA